MPVGSGLLQLKGFELWSASFWFALWDIHEDSYGKELVFCLVFFGGRYALIDLFFVCTLTN